MAILQTTPGSERESCRPVAGRSSTGARMTSSSTEARRCWATAPRLSSARPCRRSHRSPPTRPLGCARPGAQTCDGRTRPNSMISILLQVTQHVCSWRAALVIQCRPCRLGWLARMPSPSRRTTHTALRGHWGGHRPSKNHLNNNRHAKHAWRLSAALPECWINPTSCTRQVSRRPRTALASIMTTGSPSTSAPSSPACECTRTTPSVEYHPRQLPL